MEQPKTLELWKPITFSEKWLDTSVDKLDILIPSWEKRKEELKSTPNEYEEFIERLKRQHAIETGIIERLYDLKQGITQTFISLGFKENLLSKGDTDIAENKLMQILNDHADAVNFVFSYISIDRTITKFGILELHQLIVRNQHTTEAKDPFGNIVNIELIKGAFKRLPNNPVRQDGTIIEYCPPVHVDSEIENLITIYHKLEEKNIHPVIIAAWFHYCFSIIHPFQDGNGRMSRLLTSIILIKHNLFPFTVNRTERTTYINSLEQADLGNYSFFINFICNNQIENIEVALNWEEKTNKTFAGVIGVLKTKLTNVKETKHTIQDNRNRMYDLCLRIFNTKVKEIENETMNLNLHITTKKCEPTGKNYYWYTSRIFDFAKSYNYYFNKNSDRGWMEVNFQFADDIYYKLVISLHHYGRNDSTLVIAPLMECGKKSYVKDEITPVSLAIKPFTFAINIAFSDKIITKLESEINNYMKEIFTLAIAQIVQDI